MLLDGPANAAGAADAADGRADIAAAMAGPRCSGGSDCEVE